MEYPHWVLSSLKDTTMSRSFLTKIVPFLLLAGSVISTRATAEDNDSTSIRVMSFNIRYGTANDGDNHWSKRKDFLLETIQAYNPDLLGTQETLGFQKDFIAAGLMGYAALGVGREDGKQQGEMTALFYKSDRFEKVSEGHFWLSDTPDVAGSKSWDSSLPRMVSYVFLKDRRNSLAPPILFLNTHFDHRGAQARLESAKLIANKADELSRGGPAILTGDFNTAENSEPYNALFDAVSPTADSAKTWLDTYRVAHPEKGENEGTFSSFKVETQQGPRIDWIGCTQHWSILNAGIDRTARDGRTPSDHFPITAELQFKR